MHDLLFENQRALEDEDLARYAVEFPAGRHVRARHHHDRPACRVRSIFDKVNTQIGSTTFNGKRRIELLCGPSLNKSTACTEAEKHRQPSNIIQSVVDRAYPAIRFIPNRPVRPTEVTKGVSV